MLRETFSGTRRYLGAQRSLKSAADGDLLRVLLAAVDGNGARAVRDRALRDLGMAAALRRSELVALRFEGVLFVPEDLTVLIRSSQTDQTGEGVSGAVPGGSRIRPKALLLERLRVGQIDEGPLFRRLTEIREKVRSSDTSKPTWRRMGDRVQLTAMSDRSIALIVQAHAKAAGLDPAHFAGHSLRSGFLTESARQQNANILKMPRSADTSRSKF